MSSELSGRLDLWIETADDNETGQVAAAVLNGPKLSARSVAAERMRRHRQRQRDGFRCVTIELGEFEINTLVRMGFLQSEMRNNAQLIKHALYQLLDQVLECDA